MRAHARYLDAVAFISLIAFSSFSVQADAQDRDNVLRQLRHPPKLRTNVGKTRKAEIADSAAGYKVLYSFCSQPLCVDGGLPLSGLISDRLGNLYGTTSAGIYGGGELLVSGTVFKIAPPVQPAATWTETVLYSFCANNIAAFCMDGNSPASGLIEDAAGNLYGTTGWGGASDQGTVFELTPPTLPTGTWTETVLYSFCSQPDCADGNLPSAGLIQDAAGSLYGTTSGGSDGSNGTVFKLAPPAQTGGTWTETVLYTFCSQSGCTDGRNPIASLIRDAAGNLYGTTEFGGANSSTTVPSGGGTVFELTPPTLPTGTWTETVLYSFCSQPDCADGNLPSAGLIQDAAGNLYGTTSGGSDGSNGTVFKLAPPAQTGGAWTETVLYTFCSQSGCMDGRNPIASLIEDSADNLYGTTIWGGASDQGTVFKLTPPTLPTGAWTETVLYNFCSQPECADGKFPSAGLIQDAAGNMYGTTVWGGANNSSPCYDPQELNECGGTIFEVAPSAAPSFVISGAAVSVSPGATTGNTSTITITPSGGFTGEVTLAATITSSPTGAQDPPTLSFGSTSPVVITGNSAGTATLIISTTAPTSTALRYPASRGSLRHTVATSGMGLLGFAMLVSVAAAGRTNWRKRLLLLLVLGPLIGSLITCSGGGASGRGEGGSSTHGTTAGSYTATITGTSGSVVSTGTVTLTVQ